MENFLFDTFQLLQMLQSNITLQETNGKPRMKNFAFRFFSFFSFQRAIFQEFKPLATQKVPLIGTIYDIHFQPKNPKIYLTFMLPPK